MRVALDASHALVLSAGEVAECMSALSNNERASAQSIAARAWEESLADAPKLAAAVEVTAALLASIIGVLNDRHWRTDGDDPVKLVLQLCEFLALRAGSIFDEAETKRRTEESGHLIGHA
jgi:hypothetical protein